MLKRNFLLKQVQKLPFVQSLNAKNHNFWDSIPHGDTFKQTSCENPPKCRHCMNRRSVFELKNSVLINKLIFSVRDFPKTRAKKLLLICYNGDYLNSFSNFISVANSQGLKVERNVDLSCNNRTVTVVLKKNSFQTFPWCF